MISALLNQGYSVQLRHDGRETDWAAHGWVAILTADGKEVARSEDAQHNRNYGRRQQMLRKLGATAHAALGSPQPAHVLEASR